MNTRSLRFQLVAWYAGLLTGCFVLIGAATYMVLQSSLIGALRETQSRRARQIGQLLLDEIRASGEARVGAEIQARYAPDLNGRFVRITRNDGGVLYVSGAPKDQTFVPTELPPPSWPSNTSFARQVPLPGGREMLLTAHAVQTPGGARGRLGNCCSTKCAARTRRAWGRKSRRAMRRTSTAVLSALCAATAACFMCPTPLKTRRLFLPTCRRPRCLPALRLRVGCHCREAGKCS